MPSAYDVSRIFRQIPQNLAEYLLLRLSRIWKIGGGKKQKRMIPHP
jgi:hypothetical protein